MATRSIARIFRLTLFLVFGWFSLDLLLRCWYGHEMYWMRAVKSPLVSESFVSLAFLLLVFSKSERERTSVGPYLQSAKWQARAAIFLLFALCLASFAWSLSTPLLYDDYGHVAFASNASLRAIGEMFVHPHVDIFFRPVGFFFYFLNFKWAHWDPFLWHCWSLGLHILNCFLVYALSRQLGFTAFASAFAGAIFAVHGSRAEPVCWTDAQFDLLVTLFVVGALVCFGYYAKRTHWLWLAAGGACSTLAVATKEAGFCLPFLLATLLFFYRGDEQRRLARLLPAVFAGTVLAFLYRWRMIGGIGGYQTGGHANELRFSTILTCKTLGWRIWSLAFFPINWANGTGWWLRIGVPVFLIVLILVITKTRVHSRRALGGIAFVIAACLPALSVLLINSDLAGSRVLYLPFVGLALFWAAVIESTENRRALGFVIAGGVLAFNVLVLQHNIQTWRTVASEAQHICQTVGQQLSHTKGPVEVMGVPDKHLGVYFLKNGFAQCVEANSGVPASRISVTGDLPPNTPGMARFEWDPNSLEFKAVQ